MLRRAWVFGLTTLLLAASVAGAVDGPAGRWPDQWGSQRALVRVEQKADAVRVHLPWRRPDQNPRQKAVLVVDATTGKQLQNVVAVSVGRESGDLVFEPVTAPGDYHVYYLPAKPLATGNPHSGGYVEPKETADEAWRIQAGVAADELAANRWRKLPEARFVEFQAIRDFDRFTEMEQIATRAETDALLARFPDEKYLLFVEDRQHPIRMTRDLPRRWIERDGLRTLRGQAHRGEFHAWQVGVFAARVAIEDVEVAFEDLRPASGQGPSIPASAIRCFNQGGVDWQGHRFTRTFDVERGRVRALWFGAAVPRDLPPGRYDGAVTIAPKGMPAGRVEVSLDVDDQLLEDGGDSEPWRHARLRWLDSTIALDDEPVAPYPPLQVTENTIACLGRRVSLDENGLPESVRNYFAPEMTHLVDRARELLAAPIRFAVQRADGTVEPFSGGKLTWTMRGDGAVAWHAESTVDALRLRCDGRMEFDGCVEYRLRLTADEPTDVKDLRLEIPLRRDVARYMMGLGRPGGLRPARFTWKWDRAKHQDCVWVGDVNAGVQCRLFGENYVHPLMNQYYAERPLNLPPAWFNDGQGSVTIAEEGQAVVLRASGGPRSLGPGQTLHFHFRLLLTPFRPIDPDGHWARRYYHRYRWPNRGDDDLRPVVHGGANVVNIHQGNQLNPYINYPFLTVAPLSEFVRRAHEQGLRVKIYYTVRELTTHLPELWALRSLGDEVLAGGDGGGPAWLREHLVDDYRPAWYDAPVDDASILTVGMSRWHNFYLEGLDWLVRNVEIDGLYLDDVAYDRTVMKRVRKILNRGRPDPLIDLHSWNHFCPRAGFACCANLYMESLPYVDRIWFGEGRDYNTPPDYWLVEISGIPFGVMGEMLQGGGNPWRGMVYGMTNRWGWGGDPRPLWRLWDEFGMAGSRMIGYWSPACPVATDQESVLATVYHRPDKTLVALASWAPEKVSCRLKFDWAALGLDAARAELRAPAIERFQPAEVFQPQDAIPIEPGRGWLLILQHRPE
ncbi:MAG: hypothetical protein JW809_02070 [Pirellulales bacterium]|nr:hypothetical protein [Pirellulales bacterium]